MVSAAVIHRALILCLVVGLAFSIYATIETYDVGARSACQINSYVSCGAVDTSDYTHVGPIPDWSIGVGGFLVMILVEIALIRTYDVRLLHTLFALTTIGLLVAVALGSVEVFLIHAICPVCLGSYLSNVGVFGCVLGLERQRRRREEDEGPAPPKAEDEEEADGDDDDEPKGKAARSRASSGSKGSRRRQDRDGAAGGSDGPD